MGILYIVSTPIGNLKDITLRALEVLKTVDYILCEDSRVTGKLLHEYQIEKRMVSFNEFNEELMVYPHRHSRESGNLKKTRMGSGSRIKFGMTGEGVIADLEGELSVALVSDAGTPLISDPGFKLVREAVHRGIEVKAIPGSVAAIAAITVSGMPTDKFTFVGYLPKKDGKRNELLLSIKQARELVKSTVIIYESPYRLLKSLESIKNVFGDIEIVICRELTKLHEEIIRRKLSESMVYLSKNPPRGEFIIVL